MRSTFQMIETCVQNQPAMHKKQNMCEASAEPGLQAQTHFRYLPVLVAGAGMQTEAGWRRVSAMTPEHSQQWLLCFAHLSRLPFWRLRWQWSGPSFLEAAVVMVGTGLGNFYNVAGFIEPVQAPP